MRKARIFLSGFSIIETVLVISMAAFCTVLTIENGLPEYAQIASRIDRTLLLSSIREARAEAMQNEDASMHGIYADSTHIVMFTGTSYETRNQMKDLSLPFLVPEIISTESSKNPSSVEMAFDQSSGILEESVTFSIHPYGFPPYRFESTNDGSITSL